MKKEASEPNGNESYIYHRILSWFGDHKMKLIAITLILGVILGGQWYLSQGECDDLSIKVEWIETEGVRIDYGDEPVAHCYENQELELVVKVTAIREGHLKIIAKRETGKPVKLTKEKGNWSIIYEEITIVDAYVGQPLTELPFHIWAKSREEPDKYTCGITIYGYLDECSTMAKASIDVSEKKPELTETPQTTPPETTEPPIQEQINQWIEENCCLTVGVLIVIAIFLFFIGRKRKKKKR